MEAANQPPPAEEQQDHQEPVTGVVRLRVENVSEMAMERKYSVKNEIARFKWELVARKAMPMVPDGKKRQAERNFEQGQQFLFLRQRMDRQRQLMQRAAELRQQAERELAVSRRGNGNAAGLESILDRLRRNNVQVMEAEARLDSIRAVMDRHAAPVHVHLRSRARRRRVLLDDEDEVDSNQSNAATAGSSAPGTVADPSERADMKPEPFISLMLVCAEQKTRPGNWSCTANVQIILSGPKKERTWTFDGLTFSNTDTDDEEFINRPHIKINWATLMADYVGARQGDWIQVQAKLTVVEQIGYGLMPLNDVLIVNDCRFHVNKAYLAAFSNFFRAMFFAPTLQNGALAADGEHQITDPTDNINAFKLMLKIAHPESSQQPNDDLIVDVLHLADKYDLPNVTEQCEKFLMTHSKLPTIQKLGLADQYKLVNLKKQAVQQVQPLDFCELLEESVGVFNQLSEPLRRELGTHMKRRVRQARIVEDDDVVHLETEPGPSAAKRARISNCPFSRARSPPTPHQHIINWAPRRPCSPDIRAARHRGSPPPPGFFINGNNNNSRIVTRRGGLPTPSNPAPNPAPGNAAASSSSSGRIHAAADAVLAQIGDILAARSSSNGNNANNSSGNVN